MRFPSFHQKDQQEPADSLFTEKRKTKNSTFKKIILISLGLHILAFLWFSLNEEEPKKPEPMVVTLLPPTNQTQNKSQKAEAPKQSSTPKPAKPAAQKKAVTKQPTKKIKATAPKKTATKAARKVIKKPIKKPVSKPTSPLTSRLKKQGASQQSTRPNRPEIEPIGEEIPDTRNAMESFRKIAPTEKSGPKSTIENKVQQTPKDLGPSSNNKDIPSLGIETGTLRKLNRSSKDQKPKGKNSSIEGQIKGRALLFKPTPPKLNIKKEISVTLKFTVLPDGTVDQIIPTIKADSRFEEVAIELLRQFRFETVPSSVGTQSGSIQFVLHPSP